jgi:hypothetical protein
MSRKDRCRSCSWDLRPTGVLISVADVADGRCRSVHASQRASGTPIGLGADYLCAGNPHLFSSSIIFVDVMQQMWLPLQARIQIQSWIADPGVLGVHHHTSIWKGVAIVVLIIRICTELKHILVAIHSQTRRWASPITCAQDSGRIHMLLHRISCRCH